MAGVIVAAVAGRTAKSWRTSAIVNRTAKITVVEEASCPDSQLHWLRWSKSNLNPTKLNLKLKN